MQKKKFHFYSPYDACPNIGLQQVELESRQDKLHTEDLDGYCMTFSLLMIHTSLLNDSSEFRLMEEQIYRTYPPGVALSNFVRGYFLFIINLVYRVAAFAVNIPMNVRLPEEYFIVDFLNQEVLGCVIDNVNCHRVMKYYSDPQKYTNELLNFKHSTLKGTNISNLTNYHYIENDNYQVYLLSQTCTEYINNNKKNVKA